MNIYPMAAVLACLVACSPTGTQAVPAALEVAQMGAPLDRCESRGALVYEITSQRDAGQPKEAVSIRLAKAATAVKADRESFVWLDRLLTVIYDHPELSPDRLERAEIRACYGNAVV